MFIEQPKEFTCSLSEKEKEILQKCDALIRDLRNTLESHECEYFESQGEEIGDGHLSDLEDMIAKLYYIRKMY